MSIVFVLRMYKSVIFSAILTVSVYAGCADTRSEIESGEKLPLKSSFINLKDDPLALVVEIGGGGELSLNRIETGSIKDPELLCRRLTAVFEDRKRNGINERQVYLYQENKIERNRMEYLIGKIAETNAAPIILIDFDENNEK